MPVTTLKAGPRSMSVVAGEVLVVPASATAVDDLARRLSAPILERSPRAGLVRLGVPDGISQEAFLAMLGSDPDVSWVGPNHVTAVTSAPARDCEAGASTHGDARWPLDRGGLVATCTTHGPEGPTGIRVAILDTGLAYESFADALGSYGAAPGMVNTPVLVPPGADPLNLDDHPNDDHHHGTHITSIVANNGPFAGGAPGVTVVPIKVLDKNGIGTESALIEGLFLAAETGVDVINLSLAFQDGYRPSWALQQAMRAAELSGAVLVASTGNSSAERVHYPAAFPGVIAVGASRPDRGSACGGGPSYSDHPTAYTSRGYHMDLMAPGGSLYHNRNCDTYLDAIFAETLVPGAPQGSPQTFAALGVTGTSQAAAHVSAAVAWMLAEHPTLDAAQVRAALLSSSADYLPPEGSSDGGPGFDASSGMGQLRASVAVGQGPTATPLPAVFVNLLPVIYAEPDGTRRGFCPVEVVSRQPDGSLAPMVGVRVMGDWGGSTGGEQVAVTDGAGVARFTSAAVPASDTLRFAFEVIAVEERAGVGARPVAPLGFLRLGDGLERSLEVAFSTAAPDTVTLFEVDPSDPSLAVHFDPARLQPAFVYKVLGAAGITAPMAAVLAPGLLDVDAGENLTLDLGGSFTFGWGTASSVEARAVDGTAGVLQDVGDLLVLPLDVHLLGPSPSSTPLVNAVWDTYAADLQAFNPAFSTRMLSQQLEARVVGNGYAKTIFGTIVDTDIWSEPAAPVATPMGAGGGSAESDDPDNSPELGACVGADCSAPVDGL